jgi:hypothetical protein
MSYLWDTNIVIYYLQQLFPAFPDIYMDELLEQHTPVISAITRKSHNSTSSTLGNRH